MKHLKLYLLLMLVTVTSSVSGQLEGTRICLDPGHGGHDSNDRQTDLGIDSFYYESDANWDAVLHLEKLLKELGAEVKLTRTTNDPEANDRDPSLADRVQVGNAFNSDYFHSFHTNGLSNPDINYTVVLYPGPEDGIADFPESVEIGEIMAVELFKYVKTTSTAARADIPFSGFTNGYGILNGLNMPGTLSEVSFHSNINEGRRLMNTDYRKGAAYGLTKSFLRYFEQDDLPKGELGGVVSDQIGNPLNNVNVTFNPGTEDERIYTTDQFLNGFYFFDTIAPGDYELSVEKNDYYTQEVTVIIEAGKYTELDVTLIKVGSPPTAPKLTSIQTIEGNDGVYATWEANPETIFGGYRLYYATDDDMNEWALAADEAIMTSGTTEIAIESMNNFIDVPTDSVSHFRLVAISVTGAESGFSDTYSRAPKSEKPKVLIVDGFDRISGSYKEAIHSFATGYLIGLRNSQDLDISTFANEKIASDPSVLNYYDLVVWFVGDDSTVDETFSTEEQGYIKNYLQNGGDLVVSGAEIGWDLDNKGNNNDRAFYNNFLKAEYKGDGAIAFTPATGINATIFEGVSVHFGTVYPEDFPDEIDPTIGAIPILKYNAPGRTAGIGYKGMFPEGTEEGGVVNIGFALETALEADQEDLLRQILVYLGIGEEIVPTRDLILQENLKLTIYPNPSAANAYLNLSLNAIIQEDIQLLATGINGEIMLNQKVWLGSNNKDLVIPSEQWPAGTYFISVSTMNEMKTLLFIKL